MFLQGLIVADRTMGTHRIASRIDQWRRRPRFRAPAAAILLPILFAAGLLASLAPGSRLSPSPSSLPAAPRLVEPPVPLPPESPPAIVEAPESGCPHGCSQPPPGCGIKGNISLRTGEKIYHLPGQRYYEVTVISPSHGEAWFCTEAEARENGWRKSKR